MPIVREPLDPRVSLSHWLAFQLRYLREAHGLSLTQVGRLIGAARSTVSNIEAGRARIDEKQAFILDQRYNTGFLLQLLVYYARLGHDPEWFKHFSTYEGQAEILKIYAGSVIPGPFQTERYARALLAESRNDTEEMVASRMARQSALLDREDPPWIWVIVDEAAVETVMGSVSVMKEQLEHLLKINAMSFCSVRILDRSSGAHPGNDGTFRVITLESREVGYSGAKLGGRLIEEPAEVRTLSVDFDRIGIKALSENETNARIDRQLEAFSP